MGNPGKSILRSSWYGGSGASFMAVGMPGAGYRVEMGSGFRAVSDP